MAQADNPYNSTLAIVISFISWLTFYFSVRVLFPNKSPEWCSRMITFFHGVGSAINGIPECFSQEHGLFAERNIPQSENQQVIMVVSLGYFLVDFLWCLYYQTESKLMLGHHLFSTCALYRMLWKNTAGVQTVCALGGMEVTNPILQIRWFLKNEGYKNSRYFTCVELAFVAFFFVMRLIFGTYFFISVTFLFPYDWEYIFMTVTLYIISLMFFIQIVTYVSNRYIDIDNAKSNSVVVES